MSWVEDGQAFASGGLSPRSPLDLPICLLRLHFALPAASASTEAGRLALQELRALPEDRAALETETRVNLLSDIG